MPNEGRCPECGAELSADRALQELCPRCLLVLGLGGGVIPRDMRHYYPEAEIDVVEIDDAIPPLAVRYFAFKEDEKMKVHVQDGRVFIKKQLRHEEVPKYDIIVLDEECRLAQPLHAVEKGHGVTLGKRRPGLVCQGVVDFHDFVRVLPRVAVTAPDFVHLVPLGQEGGGRQVQVIEKGRRQAG